MRDVMGPQMSQRYLGTRKWTRQLHISSCTAHPNPRRPSPLDRLKVARSRDPTVAEIPSEPAYSGMKNGGTKSGKVPIAEPISSKTNFGSRKRFLRGSGEQAQLRKEAKASTTQLSA